MTDAAPSHERIQVFICHASEDKSAVRKLCRRLDDAGFAPWIDERELLPGEDWDDRINVALHASQAVLVCLSRVAVSKAGYLQKEIAHALDVAEEQPEGATFLIPVKLEPCEVPRRLARWEFADLAQDGGFERLVATLQGRGRQIAGRALPADSREAPHAPGRRRRYAYGIAAASILVAAAGAYWYASRVPRPVLTAIPVQPQDMVAIPGANLLMGRDQGGEPAEAPAHAVTVQPFRIDRFPVTNREYLAFVRETNHLVPPNWTGNTIVPGSETDPVTMISWGDAEAYCEWKGRRLPSEAEWEFAARGTDGRLYPWGEDFLPGAVNSSESGLGRVTPVEVHAQNVSPFGVREMSGNVWQWCRDDFVLYAGSAARDKIPPGTKAIRGGSFASDRHHVTTTTRNMERPARQSPSIGFRCAQ
jgi:formylglycine-generating enzyme required for sulfatase activity